jgi:hypothetical protein
MTHIENIRHILQHGITHMRSSNKNSKYVPIGDRGLINNREHFVMPNQLHLGDYIPFYFGTRMPMLFVICNGYNNVKRIPSEQIVYCITSVFEIVKHQLEFVYTNGHGVDDLTEFFEPDVVTNIFAHIDKTAIDQKYWRDDKDLDLKRRKEAEFLVRNDIPAAAILGYAVYNLAAKQNLINLGINDEHIVIKPAYYF